MIKALVLAQLVAPAIQIANSDHALCSVSTLRNQPGYQYTVEQVRGFVIEADVIVRASVMGYTPPDPSEYLGPLRRGDLGTVRLGVIEVLRGSEPEEDLTVPGRIVEEDDFNPDPVPYRMVRRSGQRGDCYARDYRMDGEYLFPLEDGGRGLTPMWAPLAPINEQIRGPDDPWVEWVRGQL